MNPLEEVIRFVSPERALRRAHARWNLERAEELKRYYDGAKMGRRTSGWMTSNQSANAEIGAAWSRLTSRSRDLVRNNPYARKAITSFERNMVRTGIKVKFDNKRVQQVWNQFVDQCDANGQLDLYGQERLMVRSWKESAECLVHFQYEPSRSGLAVPLTFRVLESDYLDPTKTGPEGSEGNFCITGVEFDKRGRRVAYWMFEQHPGEIVTWKPNALQSKRIDAADVVHLYQIDRPGQVRGVVQLAAAIMRLRDLDDYQEAELVRKKIEACFVAFVSQPNGGPSMGDEQPQTDNSKTRLENVRPGMIKYLPPDAEVKFGAPAVANDSAYTRDQLHAIAAGADVTYEQMTGDLSQVNYSSIRAGLVEFRALVEMEQWLTFIPMGLKPIVRKFQEVGFQTGVLRPAPLTVPVSFTTPKLDWVDPLKEVLALKEELKGGLKSISEGLRERGYDPEEVFAEIAKERETLAKAGITVDVILGALTGKGNDKALDEATKEDEEKKEEERLLQLVLKCSPAIARLLSQA